MSLSIVALNFYFFFFTTVYWRWSFGRLNFQVYVQFSKISFCFVLLQLIPTSSTTNSFICFTFVESFSRGLRDGLYFSLCKRFNTRAMENDLTELKAYKSFKISNYLEKKEAGFSCSRCLKINCLVTAPFVNLKWVSLLFHLTVAKISSEFN